MRSVSRFVVLLGLLLFTGCSKYVFTPSPSKIQATIADLPANRVTVDVQDLRPDHGQNKLAPILKKQFTDALGAADGTAGAVATLHIDVLEHRAYARPFVRGAGMKLRARLALPSGESRGPWNAAAETNKFNWWGNLTAKHASQDVYNAAVADLISQLGAASVKP